MPSIIWYIYEFARKTWIDGFFDAKSKEDIAQKPDRFRDFPKVIKENCIGCGSCTASCPSPNAIKLIRDSDSEEAVGLIYPVIIRQHVSDAVSVLKSVLPLRKHWNVEKTTLSVKNSISFHQKENTLWMITYVSDVISVWMPVKSELLKKLMTGL